MKIADFFNKFYNFQAKEDSFVFDGYNLFMTVLVYETKFNNGSISGCTLYSFVFPSYWSMFCNGDNKSPEEMIEDLSPYLAIKWEMP